MMKNTLNLSFSLTLLVFSSICSCKNDERPIDASRPPCSNDTNRGDSLKEMKTQLLNVSIRSYKEDLKKCILSNSFNKNRKCNYDHLKQELDDQFLNVYKSSLENGNFVFTNSCPDYVIYFVEKKLMEIREIKCKISDIKYLKGITKEYSKYHRYSGIVPIMETCVFDPLEPFTFGARNERCDCVRLNSAIGFVSQQENFNSKSDFEQCRISILQELQNDLLSFEKTGNISYLKSLSYGKNLSLSTMNSSRRCSLQSNVNDNITPESNRSLHCNIDFTSDVILSKAEMSVSDVQYTFGGLKCYRFLDEYLEEFSPNPLQGTSVCQDKYFEEISATLPATKWGKEYSVTACYEQALKNPLKRTPECTKETIVNIMVFFQDLTKSYKKHFLVLGEYTYWKNRNLILCSASVDNFFYNYYLWHFSRDLHF